MGKVKIVKRLKFTDGNGETYDLKDAIVIDLTGNESLETLLEEAFDLLTANKIKGF